MDTSEALAGREVGYDIPALPGMAEAEVQTPCLVIDLDALERNLRRMADYCAAQGVRLRPHGKMHKSADVAKLQLQIGGAQGICCQKVSEAEAFARAGIADILVSNEVTDPLKIDRMARMAAGGVRTRVCVDDQDNVAVLSAAAVRHGATLGCLVELDSGAGRCGVATPADAVALARRIAAASGLRFDGLQAYQGALQHVVSHAARKARALAAISRAKAAVAALRDAGLPCDTVSGGGTGSYRFEAESGVYTELQCGSYAFMDADYGRIGDAGGARLDAGGFANALFVLTSIMSRAVPGVAVCDAGLKAQSGESGLPIVHGRPGLAFVGYSDEHGQIADPEGLLKANDRLRLVPAHCDPTCNLHDWFVAVRAGRVEAVWPVTARGKVF